MVLLHSKHMFKFIDKNIISFILLKFPSLDLSYIQLFKLSLIYIHKALKTKIWEHVKKNEPTCEKTRCGWMRKTKAQNSLALAQSDQHLRYSH